MDTIVLVTFWFSSIAIFPLWVMMWFFPKHANTKKIVGDSRFSMLPLAISYAILLTPNILNVLVTLGSKMPTPEIVIELFSDEQMIILAWLHFLVMDTFAGRYVWLRMVEKDKPIYHSMPVLFLCMMVAPIGLALGVLTTTTNDEYKLD